MKLPATLKHLPMEDYNKIKNSGMLWEWYPEATGNYHNDTRIKDVRHYRAKEEDISNKSS